MQTRKLLFILSLFFLPSLVHSQNYSKIFQDAVKKTIGDDIKKFKTFSYPTDNYGLLTTYERKVNLGNMLCDMMYCIDTSSGKNKDWLNLNGYAAVGKGGPVEMEQELKNSWGAEVVLPKIYKILGISTDVSVDKKIDVNVSIDGAYIRTMRKQLMSSHINSLSKDDPIFKAYNNGRLVLIVADCIIEGVTVKVAKTSALNAKLNAKVGAGDTEVVSKVFSDAKVSVRVDRSVEGDYTIKFDQPLIFATLSKKQPRAGELGSEDNYDDWLDVNNEDMSVSN
ncbi:hypothetical protein PV783_24555 [Chitinophaga sp. CC14]|uniref:hypothetical protein n=1 Tax=Chitinophaga sp. CC14 TaxID=3029199 RepID=UPI003B7C07C3